MSMEMWAEKMNEWTDEHGWSVDSLHGFVNYYATTYEEYNYMTEIVDDILGGISE